MRIRSILIALLVVSCLLVLPFQHSYSQQIDRTSSDSPCGWSCWGANGNHTFSVPDECAPDVDTLELLWSFESDEMIVEYVISDGFVYYSTKRSLNCLNIENGEVTWSKNTGWNSDIILHKNQCITLTIIDDISGFHKEYKLISRNREDGAKQWEKTIGKGFRCYPHISTNGNVIPAISKEYFEDDILELKLYAVADGRLINSREITDKPSSDCGGSVSYIINKDSIIICIASDGDYDSEWAKLKSYDLDSLELKWQIEASDEGYLFDDFFLLDDEQLYIPSIRIGDERGATLHCIDPNNGTTTWSTELPEDIWGIMGYSNSKLYIAENDCFHVFNVETKNIENVIENSSTANNAVFTDNKIFFVEQNIDSSDSYPICYSSESGNVIWSSQIFEYKPMDIVISERKLFISTGTYNIDPGRLYCWGTPPPKGEPHRIRIEPSSAILNYNQSMQFTAKVIDLEENVLDEKITWSVVPEDAGKITADGLFMPSGEIDVCNIKATSCGKVSYCAVTIVYATLIKIEPSSASVRPGETVDFKARIVDRERKNILGIPKIWSLSNKDLGELTPLGTFTAGNKGGLSGEIICSSCGLEDRASIEIIDVNMENAITIDPETINFGKVSSDDEVSCEFTIFNHHSLPVRVDIAKFGGWFKLSRSELIIQPGESKTCTLSTVSDRLEPGVLFIGRLCLVWEGGRLSTQVTVDVEDQY
jgi:outer membrane protein assembly factor BamB